MRYIVHGGNTCMNKKILTASIVLLLLAPFLFSGSSCKTEGEGFAIYYTRDNIAAEEMGELVGVSLADEPLISFNDILSYNKHTHEMEIPASVYEGLVEPDKEHYNGVIVFCIDKQPVYWGILQWPLSSYFHQGITIMRPLIPPSEGQKSFITINFSTPSDNPAIDPRSNPLIMDMLERAGKLITEGFAIYLTKDNVPPSQMEALSNVELEDEPLIGIVDIINYVQNYRQIQLTDEAYERLINLGIPTSGKSFVVCVDKEPIGWGAFWTPVSSQSFGGIVIMVPPLPDSPRGIKNSIVIESGYPSHQYSESKYQIDYTKMDESFKKAGKYTYLTT